MIQKYLRIISIGLCILLPECILAECGLTGPPSDLMRDLMVVDCINKSLNERFPIYFNHLFYGGYLNMPSALMGLEGEIGFGYSSVPPYRNYNLRFQFLDRVEISGNYRVFSGIDDPLLSETGFGDLSDKGANVKFSILHPEDTHYVFPGIAIGFEDFTGTKSFEGRYIVFTQVFRDYDFEISLGYGQQRIRKWFGGLTWVPFRKCSYSLMQGLALVAEYDATPYHSEKREPHPDGRSQKSSINYGIKYKLWNLLDLSASCVRGEKFAYSATLSYNLGISEGLFPKIGDPLVYVAPRNTHPLGPLRPTDVLVQDLLYPLREQGFDLMQAWLTYDVCGQKILRLKVYNYTYRYENAVRESLNAVLSNLIPSNISEVIVVIDNDFMPLQEYRFPMNFVRLYGERKICPYELYLLSPMCEASLPTCSNSCLLFKRDKELWSIDFYPKTYTAFGSARGKFKYFLGLRMSVSGFLPGNLYYNVVLGHKISSDLYDVKDVDKLNPSQVINVRTDTVNYFKQDGVTVDEAYLQKNWNLGCGLFNRTSLGLFEEAYGGIATEFLYYPVHSCWAFGIEGAVLRKRKFTGIFFTDKIRKLEGFQPTFHKFHGSQAFASLYYNFEDFDIDVIVKAGQFLAKDWGVRTEISRYYPSGMRFYMWYTYTDAKDFVNGNRYHDRGVGISIPLDILYVHSSRKFWGYGISAWLRDVGQSARTGLPLYWSIRDSREQKIAPIKRGQCW